MPTIITLSGLDWLLIGGYFALSLFVGYRLRPSSTASSSSVGGGGQDFLLAGRRLTLPLFVGSLVATWYGGVLGVGEIVFRDGLVSWLTQGGFWYASYLIFALFLARRLTQSSQVTLPDQMGLLHGQSARFLATVLNFFNVVPIAYLLSLGLLIRLLTGWPLLWAIASGAIIAVLYSIWGGFRAVVYTDLMQFALMCLAVSMLMIYCVFGLGGADYLRENLPPAHMQLMGTMSSQELLVWSLIALSTLVDPNFYHRCYAAKDPGTSQRGVLIAVGFWVLFDICTTFAGLYARAAFPEADPKMGYPLLAQLLLPPGLKGLFVVGLLASVMSTIDSYCFIGAMTLSHDLPRWRGRELDENQTIRWTRLGIAGTAALASFLAMFFHGSIKSIWKTLGSLSTSAMLLPMLLGLLGFRAKHAGAVSMLGGIVGTLGWAAYRQWGPASAMKVEALLPGIALCCLGYFVTSILQRMRR
jgi:solute:Na+ symporter, SSS family